MFREVRRQNRVLEDQDRILDLLTNAEYGFLSLGTSQNGYAYGIPLSFAFDGETNSLYFHCASEGQKLDEMQKHNKVSFCIVGKTKPIAEQFTTLYESVIVFGEVILNLEDEDKRKALRLLVSKYSPGFEELGDKYMDKSWHRTFCFKVKIEHITAKSKD